MIPLLHDFGKDVDRALLACLDGPTESRAAALRILSDTYRLTDPRLCTLLYELSRAIDFGATSLRACDRDVHDWPTLTDLEETP
jgi:hypothetical protein